MQRTDNARLFVRLYLDADITPKLARLLREHGYDVLSAHEVGNVELSDPEQMSFAASQGRALLTCNAQDFTPLFEEYWDADQEHSGVIVSEQLPIGEMLRRMRNLLNSVTADEMRNNWRNLAEFAERE